VTSTPAFARAGSTSKGAAANWRSMATAATIVATGRSWSSGLMCAAEGCPVAVEVCEGNTADPLTLSAQIDKLKQRFRLQRVVMVGDRGVLTSARIEHTLRPAGLDWITALRAPAIKQLAAEGGPLQLSLFDDRDMADIASPDHPGVRLVACKTALP